MLRQCLGTGTAFCMFYWKEGKVCGINKKFIILQREKYKEKRKNMSKKRTKLKNSLLALILSIAMILTNFTGFTTAKADGLQDVTKTGLKFNTSADFPTVETVYKAGDGTITFTPATADTPATLTLDNATINRKEDGKDTYTGAFHGIKLPD